MENKAKFIGIIPKEKYDKYKILQYEYKGFIYEVIENGSHIGWQHKSNQLWIDRTIKLIDENKIKNEPKPFNADEIWDMLGW